MKLKASEKPCFHPSSFIPHPLFCLLMARVLAATAAELTKLQTVSCRLLILRRHIVAAFAIAALQYNVIARHNSFPISDCQFSI